MPLHRNDAAQPTEDGQIALSLLLPLHAHARCARALQSLARQSLPRRRFEIIGLDGGAGVPADAAAQLDWVLGAPGKGHAATARAANRAAKMASGRVVALCDPQAEFPPGFADCLLASFADAGSRARQPVVTLRGAGADAAPQSKQALAMYRQDVQLVLAAGAADMPLEDAAWLLVESGAQHLRLDISTAPELAPTLDWRDVPVFIVNRNRHQALEQLVHWLVDAGMRKLVILDNASTYPPLLDFYARLPPGTSVVMMAQNFGPYVLWEQGVHRELATPYILTDSDIVPAACCPKDLVARMLEVLRRYPDAGKVGPALRIDNLPDGYVDADTVRKWEAQFWQHPVAPGLFAAAIDTTFAMYPPHAEFSANDTGLRLGHPYLAEHTPWYAVEATLSDEERYYREHTSQVFSNWSVRGKQMRAEMAAHVAAFESRPKLLSIDSGGEVIPGWTNAGCGDAPVALHFDPCRPKAGGLALPDGALDGIRFQHPLRDVKDMHALLVELRRVARPGAKMQMRMACIAERIDTTTWTNQPWARRLLAGSPRAGWDVLEIRLIVDQRSAARLLLQQSGAADAGAPVQEVVVTLLALHAGTAPAAPVPPRPVVVSDDRIAPRFGKAAGGAAAVAAPGAAPAPHRMPSRAAA